MNNLVFILVLLCAVSAHAQDKPKFELTSPAFAQNADIPAKYTCQGGDVNPSLEIKDIPAKTKSLAITVFDPDAPEGTWVHWVAYNIPPETTVIKENFTAQYQELNDFGKYNYEGPCPSDEKPHHYVFRAYAVDAVLDVNEGGTMKDLEKALGGHTLAKSELIGLYRRPVW